MSAVSRTRIRDVIPPSLRPAFRADVEARIRADRVFMTGALAIIVMVTQDHALADLGTWWFWIKSGVTVCLSYVLVRLGEKWEIASLRQTFRDDDEDVRQGKE